MPVGILLLLAALAAPLSARGAQDAQADLRDRALAAAAAQNLFGLAAQGNYIGMVDELHPDAMAVFPRAAAAGVLREIYGEAATGSGQVVGVEIGGWEWPVTGQAYALAAEVSFILPVRAEGGGDEWFESQMYLVPDTAGRWRWFLGDSPAFVEDAIAQYGSSDEVAAAPGAPAGPSSGNLLEGDMITNVVNDLDAFYADVVSYTGLTYRSPGVVVVPQGQSAQGACGPAQGTFAGFYCPPDETLYLDEAFMLSQDPFAGAFVIAHEWAHHVQTAVGFVRVGPGDAPDQFPELYSIELEIMADCMSGVWAADATARGILAPGDIDQAVQFALEVLGDPQQVGPYDPQAHGTGEQRARAIMNGYEDGFLGCNVSIDA